MAKTNKNRNALQKISIRGRKNLWDRWAVKLRKERVRIWDKLEPFIKKDLKRKIRK